MEVLSGPVVIYLSQDEAAALGRDLAQVLRLAHGTRGQAPPALLEAFSGRLNAVARAARGRDQGQVSVPRGLPQGRSAPPLPPSEQPARLTVAQAATLAEVDPRTMRKWIQRRHVDACRGPRGALLVDIASLAAWISQRRKEERHREAA